MQDKKFKYHAMFVVTVLSRLLLQHFMVDTRAL